MCDREKKRYGNENEWVRKINHTPSLPPALSTCQPESAWDFLTVLLAWFSCLFSRSRSLPPATSMDICVLCKRTQSKHITKTVFVSFGSAFLWWFICSPKMRVVPSFSIRVFCVGQTMLEHCYPQRANEMYRSNPHSRTHTHMHKLVNAKP